jgi:hypothetical protein
MYKQPQGKKTSITKENGPEWMPSIVGDIGGVEEEECRESSPRENQGGIDIT